MTKEARYPTRESVIKALEARTREGKKNYPSVLDPEDTPLYAAARRFEVGLPKKERQKPKPIVPRKTSKSVRLAKTPVITPLPVSTDVPKGISEPARKRVSIATVSSTPPKLITSTPPVSVPVSSKVAKPKSKSEKEEEAVSWSDCCWVVDTAISRDPKEIKRLNETIEQEPEKIRRLLKEIFRPSFPAAQAAVRRFLKTAEGESLKGLIAQALT